MDLELKPKTQERLSKASDISGLPEDILLSIAIDKGLDVLEREGVRLAITNTPPPVSVAGTITLPVEPQDMAPRKIVI